MCHWKRLLATAVFAVVVLLTAGQRELVCRRFEDAAKSIQLPLWFSMPIGAEYLIMELMPKPVTVTTTSAFVDLVGREVKFRLGYEAALCRRDLRGACVQALTLQKEMFTNPIKLVPVQIEFALGETLPNKVTPGLVGHISKPFLKPARLHLDKAKAICDAEAFGGIACPKFLVDNGNVTFDDTVTTATIECDKGFKTRNGTIQDLISAPREATLICENQKWTSTLPNCYACEVGWHTAENVPGCYRVFTGPRGNIDQFNRVCYKHLGNLASIHTDEEFDFIWNLIDGKPGPLIGLVRADGGDWGDAEWTDGTPFTYDRWVAEGPELNSGRGCTRLWQGINGTNGFGSVSCEDRTFSRFVCKRVGSRIP